MTFKTVFIILVSVLVTIVLMNNTDEISFWVFGEIRVPKLTVLAVIFVLGLLVGFMLGRPRKKSASIGVNDHLEPAEEFGQSNSNELIESRLSDEDREYLR